MSLTGYDHVTKDSKKQVVRRKKPLLNWIYRKTSNGRSRFAPKAKTNFAKFVDLFNKPENREEWTLLLTDGGAGEAPMEYLITIEDGLRQYANDVHTMGTRPLRSAYHWGHKVDKWWKREHGEGTPHMWGVWCSLSVPPILRSQIYFLLGFSLRIF